MWWLALEIPATLSWKFKSQLTSSTQHISRSQRDSLGVGWFFTPSKSSPGSLGESRERDLALEDSERRTQQKTPLIFPFFSPCRWTTPVWREVECPGASPLWDTTLPEL